MTTLRITTPTAQTTLSGDRSYVLGRGRDADVVVPDGKVSRQHVTLTPEPDAWLVKDVSANGIWRDGRKVSSTHVRGEAVSIRLGAADGPEITLVADVPPRPAEPDLSAIETQLAAGAGPGRPPGAPPPPAPERVPAGAPSPGSARWLAALPTVIWLAATGFALGALLALS